MRLALAFMLLLASPALATRAAALDDVPGWQNLRWGMTEAQARQSLELSGLKVEPDNGHFKDMYSALAISLTIADASYRAVLQFSEADRGLAQVLLKCGCSGGPLAPKAYRDMLRVLEEKYGKPTSSSEQPRPGSEWAFKTTTISLSLYSLGGPFLTYRPSVAPAKKSDKDKI